MGIEIAERFDSVPWTGWSRVNYFKNDMAFIAPIENPHAGTIHPTDVHGDPHSLDESWQINWDKAVPDYTDILFCSRVPVKGQYRWITISRKPSGLLHNGLVKSSWCEPKAHRVNIFAPGSPDDGLAIDGPEGLYLSGDYHIYIRVSPK